MGVNNVLLRGAEVLKRVGQFISVVPLPPDQFIFATNTAPGATVLPFMSVDTVRGGVDDDGT